MARLGGKRATEWVYMLQSHLCGYEKSTMSNHIISEGDFVAYLHGEKLARFEQALRELPEV
jgi:hypothetical protein